MTNLDRGRTVSGATGHLMREGGTACKVDGVTTALDLGLRKPGANGVTLALVYYLYRPWVGWVREDRVTPDA